MAELHIVGAGLAGLSAAVEAASDAGRWSAIHLHEAAPQAGGRCRSFFDERLGCLIDNGNHLMLGANAAVLDYLKRTGGMAEIETVAPAAVPFLDLRTGERWTLRPNRGPVPWWLLSRRRGVLQAGWRERLSGLGLLRAGAGSTVAALLDGPTGCLYERLWDPLTTAILNTEPENASARLLRRTLLTICRDGERGMRPLVARRGLSAALVEPALFHLAARGVQLHLGQRVRRLIVEADRIAGIDVAAAPIRLEAGDRLVLAVPAGVAAQLVPGLEAPTEMRPIVNVHYRLPQPATLPGGTPLLGLIGGVAQWVFARGDLLSVTVSAARSLAEESNEAVAALVWTDMQRVLARADAALPPWRVIKERLATIAQTPAQLARRPPPRTGFGNLVLAGDWTDTGLPATIEGAILSGRSAARLHAA